MEPITLNEGCEGKTDKFKIFFVLFKINIFLTLAFTEFT